MTVEDLILLLQKLPKEYEVMVKDSQFGAQKIKQLSVDEENQKVLL